MSNDDLIGRILRGQGPILGRITGTGTATGTGMRGTMKEYMYKQTYPACFQKGVLVGEALCALQTITPGFTEMGNVQDIISRAELMLEYGISSPDCVGTAVQDRVKELFSQFKSAIQMKNGQAAMDAIDHIFAVLDVHNVLG